MEKLRRADRDILLWIQNHIRNRYATVFWKIMTALGNLGIFWLAVCAILWFMPQYKRTAEAALVSLASTGVIISLVLKPIFHRVRPYDSHEVLVPLIPHPKDLSFPSGHTGASFSCAVVFLLRLPAPVGLLFVILAALIAFSRMYLGVHYLTDIAAGAGVGILCAICSSCLIPG